MSLLLDALKKAEKAKDEAKRRAQGEGSAPDPDDTVIHVRTRDELPDISRPLEIHTEDIPGPRATEASESPVPDAFYSAPSPRAAEEAKPLSQPFTTSGADSTPKRRSPPPRADDKVVESPATQQAAAKKVFEAKFREPNPRLPFYITMVLLGLFSVGTVVYFWYQLRPPPALVNTDAKPPADEKKIDIADTRPTPGGQPAPQAPVQAPSIPGLPAQPAAGASPPGSGRQAAPAAAPAQPAPPAPPPASAAAKPPAPQPSSSNRSVQPALQAPTGAPGLAFARRSIRLI